MISQQRKDYEQYLYENDCNILNGTEAIAIDCFIDWQEAQQPAKTVDSGEALPHWSDFERIEHDDGVITYESHGYENQEDDEGRVTDTFIRIDGSRAKDVADAIRQALQSVPVVDVEKLKEED